jgi:CheY-like chemotaxis protein
MTNLNILIVEDEILVATDIEESLESLGYSVQNAVASGQAAIDEVEKNLPDIILMDIVLKGEMTGIEAANIIRKKYNVQPSRRQKFPYPMVTS